MARRIQTTLLSPLSAPAAPAPHFAARPLLTDVLSAKYGVPPQEEQTEGPPESAFQPHKQYISPYEDQALKELTDKIMKNKKKQGKRWKKMIKKIKKRVNRDKYMLPLTKKELKTRQKERHREKYLIPQTEEELAEMEEERQQQPEEPKEVIVKKYPWPCPNAVTFNRW